MTLHTGDIVIKKRVLSQLLYECFKIESFFTINGVCKATCTSIKTDNKMVVNIGNLYRLPKIGNLL